MKNKLLQIKHILDTRVVNGFHIKNNMQLKLYINTACERKVKNNPYIYNSVKQFLKGNDYQDFIINDLEDIIYIDKKS